MRPLRELDAIAARRIDAVFTDIDDTLTTDGQDLAPRVGAMWRLHDAGIAVVPVTGRPAGWCDHIARMWPIDRDRRRERRVLLSLRPREAAARRALPRCDARERRDLQRRLATIGEKILARFPVARSPPISPTAYRSGDRLLRRRRAAADARRSKHRALCEEAGATAKVSSIHVNGWFGALRQAGA